VVVTPNVPAGSHAWLQEAVGLRADGLSWRAVARKVGKPEPTVRRLVSKHGTVAA
jgi:hypothetical protein